MTGFEFAKTMATKEEKVAVLIIDAVKNAYSRMGINYDSLTESEKAEAVENAMNIIMK